MVIYIKSVSDSTRVAMLCYALSYFVSYATKDNNCTFFVKLTDKLNQICGNSWQNATVSELHGYGSSLQILRILWQLQKIYSFNHSVIHLFNSRLDNINIYDKNQIMLGQFLKKALYTGVQYKQTVIITPAWIPLFMNNNNNQNYVYIVSNAYWNLV